MIAVEVPQIVVAHHVRQEVFVRALPQIEALSRLHFSSLPNHHDREDAVAEVVSQVWEKFPKSFSPTHNQITVMTAMAIERVESQFVENRRPRLLSLFRRTA